MSEPTAEEQAEWDALIRKDLMFHRLCDAVYEALAANTVEGSGQTLSLQEGNIEVDLTFDVKGFVKDLMSSIRTPSTAGMIAAMEGQSRHLDRLRNEDRIGEVHRITVSVYAGNGQFIEDMFTPMIDAIVEGRA